VSFNVLVIPEDPTNNGYILQPLCGRVLEAAGRPRATIKILTDPKVEGDADAKAKLLSEIPENWDHMDLMLFIRDADGKDSNDRKKEFDRLENILTSREKPVTLICCAVVQELEAWLLAGHTEKLKTNNWRWTEIRAEVSTKEVYFKPFLQQHGDAAVPGGGRKRLTQEALANYAGIKTRCPELQELEDRIRAHIAKLP
jgi:hypothetical protein